MPIKTFHVFKNINGLSKMHKCFKKIPRLWPILSSLNCMSGNLSEYADFFLKCKAKTCKSNIRGTSHILLKLKSPFTVPSTSILVTIDVSSFYTVIDHEESTDTCYKKLETNNNRTLQSNTLMSCILLKFPSFVILFIHKKEDINGYLNSW